MKTMQKVTKKQALLLLNLDRQNRKELEKKTIRVVGGNVITISKKLYNQMFEQYIKRIEALESRPYSEMAVAYSQDVSRGFRASYITYKA